MLEVTLGLPPGMEWMNWKVVENGLKSQFIVTVSVKYTNND